MNLNGSAIVAGNVGGTVAHVLNASNNESIEIICGDPHLVEDLDALAEANGQRFGFRHFIISPDQQMSAEEWDRAIELHKEEFGWGEHNHFIVEHWKHRSNGDLTAHRHILVENMGPQGRQLHLSNDYARNEKLARLMEVEFGHSLTKGAHNRAVMEALEDEGHTETLDAMKADRLDEGPKAAGKFTHGQQQKAKRLGVDLPTFGKDCAKATGVQGAGRAMALAALDQGVTFRKGDKGKRGAGVIMEKDGKFVLQVNRIFGSAYPTSVLLTAFNGELKKLQQERGSNVREDNISGNRESRDPGAGQRRDQSEALQGDPNNTSGDLGRAARSDSGRDFTDGRAGERDLGSISEGSRSGRGDEPSRSGDHEGVGRQHGGDSPPTRSDGLAAAIGNLKAGASINRALQKHAADLNPPPLPEFPLSDFVPGTIPDPKDPAYLKRLFASHKRAGKAAERSKRAANKASEGTAPPTPGM